MRETQPIPLSTDRGADWKTLANCLTVVFRVAAVLLAVVGCLTLLADQFWLADLVANLRLQLTIAGVVGLAAAIWLRHPIQATVQLLLLIMHFTWFVQAVPTAPQTNGPPDISVMTVNVWLMNSQYDRIVSVVRNQPADVIAVLEICNELLQRLRSELAESHPYVFARPQNDGNFGIAVFSCLPLHDPEVISLRGSSPSLTAKIRIRGRLCRFVATHPISPMSRRNFELRNRHLQEIADLIQAWRSAEPDTAVVLTGDLNLTPWSPHFAVFHETCGLLQATDQFGLKSTWYAAPSFLFGLSIDHCLVTPHFQCVYHSVGPDLGSDHRPITVGLRFIPSRTNEVNTGGVSRYYSRSMDAGA